MRLLPIRCKHELRFNGGICGSLSQADAFQWILTTIPRIQRQHGCSCRFKILVVIVNAVRRLPGSKRLSTLNIYYKQNKNLKASWAVINCSFCHFGCTLAEVKANQS